MARSRYEGVLAYPITPIQPDGSDVDLEAYGMLLDRLLDGGVHAIIPLGSAGEFSYLTPSNRKSVAETTIGIVSGRVPVIVGVSALTTRESVDYAKHARAEGADGIMVSFPTYYKLTAAEVRSHVQTIADASGLPIVVYNNPFTSAIDLDVQGLGALADIREVVAIKEATMDTNRISKIWEVYGDRFEVLGGGYDPYAFPAMALGVRGWTTAMANLVPEACVRLFEVVAMRSDIATGRALNESLLPLANLLIELGLAKAVKAGLKILGTDVGDTVAPLSRLSESDLSRLRLALDRAGARTVESSRVSV